MSAAPVSDFADQAAAIATPEKSLPAGIGGRELGVLRRRDELVRWHGRDEMVREFIYPGRTVIEVPNRPWPIGRPEDCDDQTSTGLWFDATGTPQPDPDDHTKPDGVALLCRRCGLDCT